MDIHQHLLKNISLPHINILDIPQHLQSPSNHLTTIIILILFAIVVVVWKTIIKMKTTIKQQQLFQKQKTKRQYSMKVN